MPLQRIESWLDAISYSIGNKEFHRCTTGLLDFVRDYVIDEADFFEAIRLRKKYNNHRELGKTDIPAEVAAELQRECEVLLSHLRSHDYKEVAERLSRAYPKEPLLQVENLTKRYNAVGGFSLGPINATLRPGEITGIVGENGNGKTTLLRIMASILSYNEGSVSYFPSDQQHSDPYQVQHQIAYIPQRLDSWNGTLLENLRYAAAIHGIHGHDNDLAVEYVVHRMGLSNFAHMGWSELSSGYKLRFELARMLVWSPRILILDEPLANLDVNAQQWLLQDFRQMAASMKKPVSIILSSQQLHEVEHVADNIIFLRNGKCDYSGGAGTFMDDRAHNIFELSGDFDLLKLQGVFVQEQECFCAESGLLLTLRTPREISASDVLTKLINAGLSIVYFRDISTSTKQFFHQ